MILIFFLCLKLSILHLCVSDPGYQCIKDDSSNNPEIFLISNTNAIWHSYQDILNHKFRYFCSNYYDIKFGTLEQSKEHDNVIHFAVPDYYDGKPLKKFVYAGSITNNDTVCTKTDKGLFDCNEVVNLVSESVFELHDHHLYNFVLKMKVRGSRDPRYSQFSKYAYMPNYFDTFFGPYEKMHRESCDPLLRKPSDLTIVVLCLRRPELKEVNIHPLQLIQVPDCSLNENPIYWSQVLHKTRLLAVLAPEPFEVPSEYSVPTIFYETPYLFSEHKTAFPNSMNLVPWRLLKYGFLKFIQTVGWQRVAIVTDDSEYSLEFEDELTALFNKERVTYTVIRCVDAKCEMNKIVQELSRVSARIVIANVERKHAQYLFQNAHRSITWLVRDMVGERIQYLPNHQAFSISLSTDTYTKECKVEDNILTGLSSIAQAYKNIAEEDYKVKKLEFYRRFADKAKQVTPKITDATVVVHRLYDLQVISTMSVNAMGAKLISFTNPFISGKPTDGTAHCLVTSYDYHKPCEDPLVMFLMFALMLFMLTLILISCYFDDGSPINVRYQNF